MKDGVIGTNEYLSGLTTDGKLALILHNLSMIQGICASNQIALSKILVMLQEHPADRQDITEAIQEMAELTHSMFEKSRADLADLAQQLLHNKP